MVRGLGEIRLKKIGQHTPKQKLNNHLPYLQTWFKRHFLAIYPLTVTTLGKQ